ncbi:unnamed protein product, partial [Allacma fusca]
KESSDDRNDSESKESEEEIEDEASQAMPSCSFPSPKITQSNLKETPKNQKAVQPNLEAVPSQSSVHQTNLISDEQPFRLESHYSIDTPDTDFPKIPENIDKNNPMLDLFQQTWSRQAQNVKELRTGYILHERYINDLEDDRATVAKILKQNSKAIKQIDKAFHDFGQTCEKWAQNLTQATEEHTFKANSVATDARNIAVSTAEAFHKDRELRGKQMDTHLKECRVIATELANLKQAYCQNSRSQPAMSKTKTLPVDAASLKSAGIFYDDSKKFFPHEFVKSFESFFKNTQIVEEHKVFAFKGVIKGKDAERWKSKVESVDSYDVLLQRFFDFYWDRTHQRDAIDYCEYHFVTTEGPKEMADEMIRWANTLMKCTNPCEEDIIDLLVNKAPVGYRMYLTEKGQTIEQLISKLEFFANDDVDPK